MHQGIIVISQNEDFEDFIHGYATQILTQNGGCMAFMVALDPTTSL